MIFSPRPRYFGPRRLLHIHGVVSVIMSLYGDVFGPIEYTHIMGHSLFHYYHRHYHPAKPNIYMCIYIRQAAGAAATRKGRTCWPRQARRQSGHSGFSRTQSAIQAQQKTWPHWVAAGSRRSSRQRVQRRCWRPLIQAMTAVPRPRSRRGAGSAGVCVAAARSTPRMAAAPPRPPPPPPLRRSSLLAVYVWAWSKLTSTLMGSGRAAAASA